jgi:hypothetical protein
MKLRWLQEVDLHSSFVSETQDGAAGTVVRIHDDSGALVAQAEVTVKKREDGVRPATPIPMEWRSHRGTLDSGTRASRADQGVRPTLKGNASKELALRDHASPSPETQRVALEAWQRDFTSALATYRSQRAWRVMLAVRKVYNVLARGSWAQRLALLWWIPASLLGRPSGLDAYELNFPAPKDYLTRPE